MAAPKNSIWLPKQIKLGYPTLLGNQILIKIGFFWLWLVFWRFGWLFGLFGSGWFGFGLLSSGIYMKLYIGWCSGLVRVGVGIGFGFGFGFPYRSHSRSGFGCRVVWAGNSYRDPPRRNGSVFGWVIGRGVSGGEPPQQPYTITITPRPP